MKQYFAFLGILLGILILYSNASTILPIMDDDEYFVDDCGIIHGSNCPYKNIPWFTTKHSKYEILIKADQDICKECLLLEEEKLWNLHSVNIELLENRLIRNGASDDYIDCEIEKYK